MNKVNISSVNINLLNVLHALFIERNTTKAAKRLGLSQSAVSHSLKKLRNIFDDKLLVTLKNSKQMQLTQFASSVQPEIEEIILKIESVLNIKEFSVLTSKRKFTIAITDFCYYCFISKVYLKLRELAPNVSIETLPFDIYHVRDQLELNEIDLAIGEFQNITFNKNLFYKHLFEDNITCSLNKNHPVLSEAEKLSFDNYSKYPSLIVKPFYQLRPGFKELEAKKNNTITGNIQNLTSHSTFMILHALQTTDCITLIPQRIANAMKIEGITTIEPEFIKSTAKIALCFNKLTKRDKGIVWMIKLIEEIAKEL